MHIKIEKIVENLRNIQYTEGNPDKFLLKTFAEEFASCLERIDGSTDRHAINEFEYAFVIYGFIRKIKKEDFEEKTSFFWGIF